MRPWAAVLVVAAVLLAVGCGGSSHEPSSPTPTPVALQTPNGAPTPQSLSGPTLPDYMLFQGQGYVQGDTIAHLVLASGSPVLPSFLRSVGPAAMATVVGHDLIPAPGASYAAFAIDDTPVKDAIVVMCILFDQTDSYMVFVRYDPADGLST